MTPLTYPIHQWHRRPTGPLGRPMEPYRRPMEPFGPIRLRAFLDAPEMGWQPPFFATEHVREHTKPVEWSYSAFLKNLDIPNFIQEVTTDRHKEIALIEDTDHHFYEVRLPEEFRLQTVIDKNINVFIRPTTEPLENLGDYLVIFAQMFIVGLLLNLILRGASGQTQGFPFQSFADFVSEEKTTFNDVAGLSGPKRELQEIVAFLKSPESFAEMGAVLPRGVLLTGPAGTGKTLLAKAVAGEAGVPFLYCSGSEFVQVFVGLGATRVRDLFKKAREKAPCIVFIDEIDAIGRTRSMTVGNGANSEQEQTMNQILTEMDGFKDASGIIVIAATNRKEILDEALIRSGRFDRHVFVGMPTNEERRAILEVHTRDKKIDPAVCLKTLAGWTQGMVGADLKNLVNEAAIYSVQNGLPAITMDAFHQSLDKMILGVENTAIVVSPKYAEIIAYHEAGHALMGVLVEDYDLLMRVTIVPRGDAGGLTIFKEANEDIQLYSQRYMLNRLIVALGGRVAEKKMFGSLNVTTGASGDLENVQYTARKMITEYGFNETLGLASWNDDFGISGSTVDAIDTEIKYLVDWAEKETQNYMDKYEFYLHRLAEALIKKKTLNYEDILQGIEGITCEL